MLEIDRRVLLMHLRLFFHLLMSTDVVNMQACMRSSYVCVVLCVVPHCTHVLLAPKLN